MTQSARHASPHLPVSVQPGEVRLEVQDTWYDPAASKVVPSGGQPTTRSDRLALWASQLSGTVGKMREELRATRMSVFEAQQGMRDALDQVQLTQDTLTQQVEVRGPSDRCARSLWLCCLCSCFSRPV